MGHDWHRTFFGYLEPEGTRAFVSSLARTLKPGARFALDTGMTAESILPNLQEKQWARLDDILFLEENRYLPLEVYGSLAGEAFRVGSPYLLLVAEKAGASATPPR